MSAGKKEVRVPFRAIMRIPVPWVFILAYLIGAGLSRLFPFTIANTRLFNIVGGLLFLLGAVIAGWGLYVFHKARTTTIPGKSSTLVVTWGPYRFTRNPMYIGLVLAYIGEAGLLVQIWPLFILPLIVAYLNWVVIPVEEARLTEDFGSEYEQYCAKVRRWL
ncbi:MAG: isoprenylcysteine carboxylmethyltransferase family protein [Blastocatellia bacterium]|nr:isoprenylcysteine carboxylmethyltransferase family protein [Blastocatellia bacterium]